MTELGIYPTICEENDDAFDYVSDGFLTVQNVYEEEAKKGEAIVICLN